MSKHLTMKKRVKLECIVESNPKFTLLSTAKELKVATTTVYRELINRRKKEDIRARFGSIEGSALACPMTSKFPYVCNGCDRFSKCTRIRYKYDGMAAHAQAKKLIRSARKKPYISKKELHELNKKISPRIQNRQSIYHVLQSDKTIKQSQSTIRRYIDNQYLDARNIDLPRTVEQRVQGEKRVIRKSVPANILNKRTHQDYLEYIEEHTKPNKRSTPIVVQVDTMIGTRNDKKFILTLYETSTRFQWAYVLRRTAEGINTCIRNMITRLRLSGYPIFFNIILTDNGTEFSLLSDLEFDEDTGDRNFKLFYCDPYSSYQKGGCEKNHEFFRYLYKKGTTLDTISQPMLDEAFSHINSLKRKSLQGKSPREAFSKKFKMDTAILGISEISPADIKLKK